MIEDQGRTVVLGPRNGMTIITRGIACPRGPTALKILQRIERCTVIRTIKIQFSEGSWTTSRIVRYGMFKIQIQLDILRCSSYLI